MRPPRLVVDGLWRCLCPSSERLPSSLKSLGQTTIFRSNFDRKQSLSRTQQQHHRYASAATSHRLESKRISESPHEHKNQKFGSKYLRTLDTRDLHSSLKDYDAGINPDFTRKILEILIKERHERPDERHYSALLRLCRGAGEGSNHLLRRYLQEIREADIELSSGLCHDVLEVIVKGLM
jgi:hypothetical protein